MKTIDLEGTVMQPRTSSSDIEWGTPNHPLTQIRHSRFSREEIRKWTELTEAEKGADVKLKKVSKFLNERQFF